MARKIAKLSVGLAAVLSVGAAGAANAAVTAPTTVPTWHSIGVKNLEIPGQDTAVTSIRYSGDKLAQFAFGLLARNTTSPVADGYPVMYARSDSESWALDYIPGAKPGEKVVSATAVGPNEVYVFTALPNGTGRALQVIGHSVALKGGGREGYYTWTVLKTFDAPIGSASVLNPSDIWVFGSAAVVQGLGVWHFNGKTWTRVSQVENIGSATSATNVWTAVGATVGHYNGKTWTYRDLQGVPKGEEYVSSYATGNDDYIVASLLNPEAKQAPEAITILKYNGSTWQKVATAGTGYAVAGSITGDGKGGIWFTAYPGGSDKAEVFHLASGSHTVTAPAVPGISSSTSDEVEAIEQIPGTAQELAVGWTAGKSGDVPTVYEYN
jgi:hypothetical protein